MASRNSCRSPVFNAFSLSGRLMVSVRTCLVLSFNIRCSKRGRVMAGFLPGFRFSVLTLLLPFSGLPVQRSEEHTSELQSRGHLVCRLLLQKKNKHVYIDRVCNQK